LVKELDFMRFTVATYGSEGDTRPFVALSRELMDAGHEVHLFAEQSSIGIAHTHAVTAYTLGGDIKSTLPLDRPSQQLRARDVMRATKDGLRLVNANVAEWMRALSEDARRSDAILFAGFASPVAQVVAQELNIPGIALWLQPTTQTPDFASPVLPPLRLPGWLNSLSYRVSPEAMIMRMYGKSTNAACAAVFDTSARRRIDRRFPILYGFSRHLVPRPREWPATHQICGHWPLAVGE
jgi:sterol 3beta-glucosyltransferase